MDVLQGKFQLLPPAPPYYPFPEEKSILGVIYGVLLWADMNAATPLGAQGRSVMSLVLVSSIPDDDLDLTQAGRQCFPQVAAARTRRCLGFTTHDGPLR